VTTADVTVLDGDARVAEIARMLGGDPESDVSRAHARELLESAAALSADATRPGPGRATSRRSKRG
jgi:DNA repair protein RecN (Recombination protein N)